MEEYYSTWVYTKILKFPFIFSKNVDELYLASEFTCNFCGSGDGTLVMRGITVSKNKCMSLRMFCYSELAKTNSNIEDT